MFTTPYPSTPECQAYASGPTACAAASSPACSATRSLDFDSSTPVGFPPRPAKQGA